MLLQTDQMIQVSHRIVPTISGRPFVSRRVTLVADAKRGERRHAANGDVPHQSDEQGSARAAVPLLERVQGKHSRGFDPGTEFGYQFRFEKAVEG